MYFDRQIAVGNFIKSTVEERQIVLNSDGSSVRSYMYAGDLVVWLLKMLLECPNKVILNTGSDQAMSIKESAVIVSNPGPGRVPVISSNERPRYRLRYVPSIETAKTTLN